MIIEKIRKIILLCLLLFCLSGCLGFHQIHISGDERDISCVRFARAGDTVHVSITEVDDADIYLYVNGVKYTPVYGGNFTFVMPDKPVKLRLEIIGNGLA